MSAHHDITTYTFDTTAAYFVDANVWLYVFGPMAPGDWRSRVYSSAWKRLRASGAPVFIDVLVTSEIMNRWARIEYARLGGDARFGAFKDFRSTQDFRSVASDIATAMRSILKYAKRTGTPFANVNLEATLNEFAAGTMDFVDLLICESCRARRFILITHDGDMTVEGVDVVTGNKRLLE